MEYNFANGKVYDLVIISMPKSQHQKMRLIQLNQDGQVKLKGIDEKETEIHNKVGVFFFFPLLYQFDSKIH